MIIAFASQSVDLSLISLSDHTKKIFKMLFTASMLGILEEKKTVLSKIGQVCLLFPRERHLTGFLHLYVQTGWDGVMQSVMFPSLFENMRTERKLI